MPAASKVVIYQLVVRYFGNVNVTNQVNGTLAQNGCGRFADVSTAALAELKAFGITHVWLTGCLRQATLTDYSAIGMPADDPDVTKGIAGSLYAVRDYFDVCPDLAVDAGQRMAEFKALVDRIHTAGMRVLLDLVPNHVARGYNSVVKPQLNFGLGDDQSTFFARDNHFFYLVGQSLRLTHDPHWAPPGVVFDGRFPPEDGSPAHTAKATGSNSTSASPSAGDWYETVKLNYGFDFTTFIGDYSPHPRTWQLMDQILAYWQNQGVDGFRCDMAYYVPLDAWTYLLRKARTRNPASLFLAESYPNGGGPIPVSNLDDLISAGFDAFYHSDAYNALKSIYQQIGSQDNYDGTITHLSPAQRAGRLAYLENHDERRIASPLVRNMGPGSSGFDSAAAGYQLAPLQFLFGNGPVLVFNGQEVGEPGAGVEGFNQDTGRTTTFDYWSMPEFVKWVNGHAYDGGLLAADQQALRHFYADLLALCQDSAVVASGYWGLKYFNRSSQFSDCPDDLYTFARFASGSGRLLLIAANFRPNSDLSAQVRIPQPLADTVGLPDPVTVSLILDRSGRRSDVLSQQTRQSLVEDGFGVSIPNQTSIVCEIQ
ncbi:MAG TPA: alpha-amylase family glycosyl hydrolase [Pirellulales bacterium]|jgi:glycosidase|nr:alpha-amylase family glycosyl hydrolase [Pirellulales bacterium]